MVRRWGRGERKGAHCVDSNLIRGLGGCGRPAMLKPTLLRSMPTGKQRGVGQRRGGWPGNCSPRRSTLPAFDATMHGHTRSLWACGARSLDGLVVVAGDDDDERAKHDGSAHRRAKEEMGGGGREDNRGRGRQVLGEAVGVLDHQGDEDAADLRRTPRAGRW
eukprot:1426993-Prymnesium_polylepis.1